MTKREHLAVPIGEHRREDGWFLKHVAVCADNTSFALVEADAADAAQRILFRGKVVAEGRHEPLLFALSHDGAKLAAAERYVDGGKLAHEVSINGEHAYDVPFGTVHYFDWIDAERLAWHCWDRDDLHRGEGRIHCFLNGKDVTGEFDFQPVIVGRDRHAVIVHDNGKRYSVFDDGRRTEAVDVPMDASVMGWHEEGWPETRRRGDRPTVLRDGAKARVSWQGAAGPAFDAIENDGFSALDTNEAGSLVGYVGMDYAPLARKVGRLVGGSLEKAEEAEDRGRMPLWAWPVALLFNPYFGIGHALIEGSKRYRPVVSGPAIAGPGGAPPELRSKVWKKGYRHVIGLFFADEHRLAAVVHAGLGMRLVIDEDEGPVFESIWNARVGADGRVHYLAKRGDRFYKVIVDGE